MKILGWNCRGIGNPAIVKELRDLAKDYAPSVMFIMEAQICKYRVENLRYTLGFDASFAVSSDGRSGGLGLFWKIEVTVSVQKFSNYHIDTIIKVEGKEPWRISFIYGEPNRSLRSRTWEIMKQMRSDSNLPWVCVGDFNEILRREEQLGPNNREEYLMEGFRNVVDVCQLCDIGYMGLDWTFEKKVAGGHFVRVRLDRVLASASWCACFPFAAVRHLTAVKSYHCPILLSLLPDERSDIVHGKGKPFRYELMWETNEGLCSFIQQIWKDGNHCNSVKDLKDKLFHLGEELRSWGEKTFGAVRRELRAQKKRLQQLRADPTRSMVSEEEQKVVERIILLNYQEQVMWKQRSHITWLHEGDSNTNFFIKEQT